MKVADMHCDTISLMREKLGENNKNNLRSNSFQIDLNKMQQGDYLLQNFAAYVDFGAFDNPFEEAMHLIELYYEQLELNSDIIAPVYSYSDIEKNKKEGRMSALLTLEEGEVCKGNIDYLRLFHRLGVRMMTFTWNYKNQLANPNILMPIKNDVNNAQPITGEADYELKKVDIFTPDTENGLTSKGIEFLEEMENIGIIPDVSHLSDAGFYDVYKYTKKPFVASHSNARQKCACVRNLTDDMIRKLGEKGGVMGINYAADFLKTGAQKDNYMDTAIEHIKHIVNVGGIDCVGFGSDFDGIPPYEDIKDASVMPVFEEKLKKAGFTQQQTEKIFYKNILRVYKEIL